MSKEPKTTQTKTEENKLFADTNITWKSGRLVRDAEVVSEGKFAKIVLANNKEYMDGEEVKTLTNYFDVLVSQNLKDTFNTAKDLKKGDWIYLKGNDATRPVDTLQGYKENVLTIYAYEVGLKKAKQASVASKEAPAPVEA